MQMDKSSLRETLGDAIGYWEPRRILYNIILATVFVGWVVLTWPHFREAPILQALLFLVIYAGAANLCYTAVYLVEIPLQRSAFRALWQHWRIGLWLVGILLAILFTNYWIADEIYPYVR
jgi:hypothetical protein